MTKPSQDQIELVRRLCNDLTLHIPRMVDKGWLQPALISHITHLTKLDETTVKPIVEVWFPKA